MKTITYYINFTNKHYVVGNFSQTFKVINIIYFVNEVVSFYDLYEKHCTYSKRLDNIFNLNKL